MRVTRAIPMLGALLLVLSAITAGCTTTFLHQKGQHAAAQQLVETAGDALAEDNSLWSNMESNVEAFAPLERLAIERAVDQVQRTDRRRLYKETWADIRDEVEELASESESQLAIVHDHISVLEDQMRSVADEIQTEKTKLEGEDLPVSESNIATKTSSLLDEFDDKLAQVANALEDLPKETTTSKTIAEGLDGTIEAAQGYASVASKVVSAVSDLEGSLRELSREGWQIDRALEVLRNAESLERVRELVAPGQSFSDDAGISDKYATVTSFLESEETQRVLKSVGDLQKTLSDTDVGAQLIRLRLQRDMSTSRVEVLQVDAAYLNEKAELLSERSEALTERLRAARVVIHFVDKGLETIEVKPPKAAQRSASADDGVFALVSHLVQTLRRKYKNITLSAKANGAEQAKAYNRDLAVATQAIHAAAAYVRLNGELAVRDVLSNVALARAEHIYSIRRSRVISRTWQRLLMSGAEGLEAYWAGGITPEDLAVVALLVGQVTATAVGVAR